MEPADGYAVDWPLRQSVHVDGAVGSGTRYILDEYVAERGRRLVHGGHITYLVVVHVLEECAALGWLEVIHVEEYSFVLDTFHVDVAGKDTVNYASAVAVALESQSVVGSHKQTVAHAHAAYAARHLAAYYKSAVGMIHHAAVDDDIGVVGTPRRRPASSRPDFRQMPSSPTSNTQRDR